MVAAEAQPLEPWKLLPRHSTLPFRGSGGQGFQAIAERHFVPFLVVALGKVLLCALIPDTFYNGSKQLSATQTAHTNTSGFPRQVSLQFPSHRGAWAAQGNRTTTLSAPPTPPRDSSPLLDQHTVAAFSWQRGRGQRGWRRCPDPGALQSREATCGWCAGAPPRSPATRDADAPPTRPPIATPGKPRHPIVSPGSSSLGPHRPRLPSVGLSVAPEQPAACLQCSAKRGRTLC